MVHISKIAIKEMIPCNTSNAQPAAKKNTIPYIVASTKKPFAKHIAKAATTETTKPAYPIATTEER